MTSKLKCPFCQQELRQDYTGVMYCCNEDCEQSADWYGSSILWQALIQAKQALDWIGNNRLAENPVRVEQLRRHARNALEQIDHIADASKMVEQMTK